MKGETRTGSQCHYLCQDFFIGIATAVLSGWEAKSTTLISTAILALALVLTIIEVLV